MDRVSKRLVVGLAVIAAGAFSGIAFAAEGDDTVLNYGYDQDSHFFFWNVTSFETAPDDELAEENTDEDAQLEALLAACGLEGGDPDNPLESTFTFDPATGVITVTSDEVPDGGEGIVCGDFSGGDVTGPAGQVNHGMFLKLLNQNYEGGHRGCIVSQIAGSGLGKGDQQVQADGGSEDEPTTDPGGESEVVEGAITFTTVTTDCQRGTSEEEKEKVSGESEDHGPPQRVLDKFDGQHPGEGKGKPAGTPDGRP